jgi:serine/threonine protein kinase
MNWTADWVKIGAGLGSGGQGTATRVVHKGTREIGVIKEVSCADDTARQRVIAESEILSSLRHRQIPTLLSSNCSASVTDSFLYFITSFSYGITLDRFIESTNLSTERALQIVRSLVGIVRYLHEDLNPPVLHRDIKPKNILIRNEDEPVLIDFGIAFHSGEPDAIGLTAEGESVGNRFMLLPERVTERRDKRSDVAYCVGILFYLLTNAAPGNLQSATQQRPHRKLEVQHFFNQMPPGDMEHIFDIFDKGFSHELQDRFQSAQDLLNEIDSCFRNLVSVSAKARLQSVFELPSKPPIITPSKEQLLEQYQQSLASTLINLAETAELTREQISKLTFESALESGRELRMIDEEDAELVIPERTFLLARDLTAAIDALPNLDAVERVLIWAPKIIGYIDERLSERSEGFYMKYADLWEEQSKDL